MASILMALVGLVVMSVVTSVSGFSSGAPTACCTSMLPVHTGTTPETTPAPFNISVSKLSYNPGDTVTVTITATGDALIGFLLQARRADPSLDTDEPQGTFTAIENTQLLTCSAAGDSITHTDAKSNSFKTLSLIWTAPATIVGNIQFKATVVLAFDTYWLDVTSPIVYDTVSGPIVAAASTMDTLDTSSDDSVIDFTGCGSTKGCITMPEGCTTANCDTIITWVEDTDTDYINFEMARQGSGWIGAGFSLDPKMGDDSVISCVRADDGTMTVSQSLNIGYTNAAVADPNYDGIDNVKVGYNNGQQICRFRRKKVVDGRSEEIYDLTIAYYIMIGTGDTFVSGSTIDILKHATTPFVSEEMQDLTVITDLSVTATIPLLIKAHGSFSIIAWTMLAAFALTIGRHYKKQWPGSTICGRDAWFSLHVGSTTLTVVFTIISMILIFVQVRGYSDITGTPAILKAHPILGIIVTGLAVLNPIMALFRPAANSANRFIFNWAHWGVGKLAMVLAVITIFLGVSFPSVKDVGQARYLLYVLIGFVCFYALVEVILEIHRCMTKSGKSSYIALKSSDEKATDAPASELPSGQLFRSLMLVILLAGLLSSGVTCVFILVIS